MGGEVRVIEYPSPTARRGFVGMPNAAIKVVQHDDGRWMFAFSFCTSMGGEGFHPLPKWQRFAESEQAAIEAGVSEFLDRIGQRAWADHPQARQLREWAEGIAAPAQPDLFGTTPTQEAA